MREQRKLEGEIERFGRELARLRAEQASERVDAAGGKMQEGSQAGEGGDSGKAADLADEARQELDEAQRQLAERRRQAEQDLANEQLATVEHALAGLLVRQERLLLKPDGCTACARRKGESAARADYFGQRPRAKSGTTQTRSRRDRRKSDRRGSISARRAVRRRSDNRAAELLTQTTWATMNSAPSNRRFCGLRQLLAALKEGQSAVRRAEPKRRRQSGRRRGEKQSPAAGCPQRDGNKIAHGDARRCQSAYDRATGTDRRARGDRRGG